MSLLKNKRIRLVVGATSLLAAAFVMLCCLLEPTENSTVLLAEAFALPDGSYRFTALGGPPWQPVGVNRISAVDAAPQAYFELYYRDGKLRRVRQYRPGQSLERAMRFSYDELGRLVRIAESDSRNVLVATTMIDPAEPSYRRVLYSREADNNGCYAKRFHWDPIRRIASHTCLQADGFVAADRDGQSIIQEQYDERYLLARSQVLDLRAKPAVNRKGIAAVTYRYDRPGRLIFYEYTDLNHNPVVEIDNGCAKWVVNYDGRGQREYETCLWTDGTAIEDHEGVMKYHYDYDQRGCLVRTAYLDHEARPRVDALGVAAEVDQRDEYCQLLETRSLRLDGTLSPRFPVTRYRYDAEGNLVSVGFFNAAGRPLDAGPCGQHATAYQYDRLGRMVSATFLNSLQQPFEGPCGWMKKQFSYDEQGRRVEHVALDATGRPRKRGWHTIRRRYDRQGYEMASQYLGNPPFTAEFHRNEFHRVEEIRFVDPRGESIDVPIRILEVDGPTGPYQRVKLVHLASGRHVADQYYDSDGRLLKKVDCSRGRCWQSY